MRELILGAVAYDAKVVPIWDGFRAWFAGRGLPFDYILFTNYERQVDAHVRGELDVAWNSPLAWLHALRKRPDARAIAMRDTDRDLTSVVLVRADSPYRTLSDLRGKRVGVGAGDSPQATLIPLGDFASAGINVDAIKHDVLLGKHGDHVGGERVAVKAMLAGEVEAACVIDGNRLAFTNDGTMPAHSTRVLHITGKYDHCNMTAFDDTPEIAKLTELLLGMDYGDPEVRPLLDMEGLTKWLPGRTSGYGLLERAIR